MSCYNDTMPNIPFRLLRVAYDHLGRSKCRPSVMSMHRTDPDVAEFMHHNWKACLAHALADAWPQRTAEDERRDVLAFVRRLAIDLEDDRAHYLDVHQRIACGDHEGASTR